MSYTVYIIQSESTDRFYIGYSSDVERRLAEHNSNQSQYTANNGPWKIVYTEAFQSKTEAIRRERFLKKQRNREFYQRLINSKN